MYTKRLAQTTCHFFNPTKKISIIPTLKKYKNVTASDLTLN